MRSDSEYREEIEAHIELETHANIERGMSPEQARLAAMRAFGGVEATRQRLREGRATYWLTTFLQDVRYGLRMIARNRLLSCSVALTLTVGIGITTGVFGFLNPLVFKSVVDDDPSSFALSERTILTEDEYGVLRDGGHSFRELAAFSGRGQQRANLGSSSAEAVGTTLVSCNFFTVFRAAALVGRLLEEADCSSSRAVMVLAERLWRTRFASDPTIVGKTFPYGDHLVTIVGVVRARRIEPRITAFNADAWAPYHLQPSGSASGSGGKQPWLKVAGRLNPGYSRNAATTELQTMARQFDRAGRPPVLIRFTDGSMWADQEDVRWLASLVLALPTLLMLVASVNVATLLLGRSAARRQEIAIRLAMGASRVRLVCMLLTEHFLLAGMAALASLYIAYWVPSIAFDFLAGGASARAPDFTPDWHVFAYLGVCTVVAAFASGLMPALESLNLRLPDSLRGRPYARRHRRISRIRIGVQVALSMAPLVVIAMFARAEYRLADPGLETRRVVLGFLPEEQRAPGLRRALTDRIAALPGVRSVAYSRDIPLVLHNAEEMDVGPRSVRIPQDAVSPGYFRTLGIPIVAGREFLDSDVQKGVGFKPMIVSQTFARRFLTGGNPIGSVVSMWAGTWEVVGIARDRNRGLRSAAIDDSFVYVLNPDEESMVLVRFDGDLAALSRQLRSILAPAVSSELSLALLQSYVDAELVFIRRLEALIGILGVVFVVLSVVGAFGVVAFSAIQRRKEVAIRLALGASRANVIQAILRSGLPPIPIGMVAGLLLSWGGLKLAAAQGIMPLAIETQDPLPYLAACALMTMVVLAAMLTPAHAATTSHPVDALREE